MSALYFTLPYGEGAAVALAMHAFNSVIMRNFTGVTFFKHSKIDKRDSQRKMKQVH